MQRAFRDCHLIWHGVVDPARRRAKTRAMRRSPPFASGAGRWCVDWAGGRAGSEKSRAKWLSCPIGTHGSDGPGG
jgi:hypothetical protein